MNTKVQLIDWFNCVLFQSAVTSTIYKRRLDFPYKQRIYLGFPYKKNTSIHVLES